MDKRKLFVILFYDLCGIVISLCALAAVRRLGELLL